MALLHVFFGTFTQNEAKEEPQPLPWELFILLE